MLTTITEQANKIQSFRRDLDLIVNVSLSLQNAKKLFEDIDYVYDENHMGFIFNSFGSTQTALDVLDKNGYFPGESDKNAQEFIMGCILAERLELYLI